MADGGTRSMEALAKRCRRMAETGRVSFLHAEPSERESLLSSFSVADNAALTARHGNQGLVLQVHGKDDQDALALKLYLSRDDALWEFPFLSTFSDCQLIPKVYDFGFARIEGDAVPAVLVEYICGRTLSETLRAQTGAFSPARAAELVFPLVKFLSLVSDPHTSRSLIAHRDIKPANIIVDESHDCLRLVDFGKATTSSDNVARSGSSPYVAPCCRRDFEGMGWGSETDARVDSYSVGALLLAMTCGEGSLALAETPEGAALLSDRSAFPLPERALRDARGELARIAWSRFAFEDKALLDRAFATAHEQLGSEFWDLVARCLASGLNGRAQSERPTPSELQIMLDRFCGEDRARRTLAAYAAEALTRLVAAARLDDTWKSDLEGYAHARETSSPIEAIDLFNEGRYAQAAPLLRAFSDVSASAAYYLAVCYRDGYAQPGAKAGGSTVADIMALLGAAAQKGNVMAQFNVGANLYDGVIYDAAKRTSLGSLGAMQNHAKGRWWILKAASGADGRQPLGLALEWLERHREPQDAADGYWAVLQEAFELCKRAVQEEGLCVLDGAGCCLDVVGQLHDNTLLENNPSSMSALPGAVRSCLLRIAEAEIDYRDGAWNKAWMGELVSFVHQHSSNAELLKWLEAR